MDSINIPCPKCGRELKLRDRSLLGRKGKCPKCGTAFVLQEPEVVELELANPEPKGVGRWIPDTGATATAARPATERTAVPEPAPAFPNIASNDGAAARLKELQRKNARRRNVGLVVGSLLVLAVGGIGYYVVTTTPARPAAPAEPVAQLPVQPVDGNLAAAEADVPASVGSNLTKSPTQGEMIELQYIPFGSQVVINLRPAELWQKESLGEELRYCLTPLARLLESRFEEYFKFKPEQIEEAQICLIPGTQGTLPEVAAVVHLIEEAKKSDLLEAFGGQRVDDYDHPVYITGERAYLIADQKTIAMGPSAQVKEMVDAIAGRNPVNEFDSLLPMTDRARHITVLFVPQMVRIHSPWWFPENVKPLVLQACNWFGDDVESVAWSFHLGDDTFYSDMIVRNTTGISTASLQRELRAKLDKLPYTLLDTVRMMSPREVGKRTVIGRLPKMTETFALASVMSRGLRHVQVITPLSDRAAPNLALATLLAWDESTRTDFAKERAPKPSTEDKVPELLVDRLKMKIDIDWRRTPLQDAFAYIANEIKTTIDIDGDALKAGGFTKNMPQDLKADKITAQEGIAKILERYQDPEKPANTMVIVVEQEKKRILVSTKAFCDQQGLTVFDIFKK